MNDKSNVKSLTETGKAVKFDLSWLKAAVFGLVIGILAWIADPQSVLQDKNARAEDSYYNLLVQGFRAGQLNVKENAPAELVRLADPYDPSAQTGYMGNVTDLSYYKGKLYLYFGVTPALVLFWPYAVVTGHYLPEKDALVIFFVLGFSVLAWLLREICRRSFPKVSPWMAMAGVFAIGLALALTIWCDIYETVILCGFAFVMLTLAAIWHALREREHRGRWLFLASLAYGLAIGSRPSLSFGAVILLAPVARAWHERDGRGSLWKIGRLFAAAAGPLMLIGLGLMLYNFMRFDNPFEFGWHYELHGSYRSTTAQMFSLRYVWFDFEHYFFQPIGWNGHFPFLQTIPSSSVPRGHDTPTPVCGIPVNYPMLLLALAAPLAWRRAVAEDASLLRWFAGTVFLLFLCCSATLCLFFSTSDRYELDFLPGLMILAVIGFLSLERAVAHLPLWRGVARWGWGLLAAYSIFFNFLTNLENHAAAYYLLGNSFFHYGRLDQAAKAYGKALAFWPDCADAHRGLGNTLLREGDANGAMVQYQKTLETKPNDVQAGNDLASCYFRMGQTNDAIIEWQRVLEAAPEFAAPHNNLGTCFLGMGQTEDAIVQYRRAVELDPNSANFRCGLGNALLKAGRGNDAIEQYEKAVAVEPRLAGAEYDLASGLLKMGRLNEAIVRYQTAVKLGPASAAYRIGLGDALLQKGLFTDAAAAYRKAIELEPDLADKLRGKIDLCQTNSTQNPSAMK